MTSPAPYPHRWRAFALVGTAFFMTILDAAIANVALPTIGRELEFTAEDLQWVVTAYAIMYGGFLLLGGRAADLLGRRRMFMVGLALFTAVVALLRALELGHDADRRARVARASAPRSRRRRRSRSSRRSSPRARSGTRRSASGACSQAWARPSACSSAAS